MGTTGKPVAGTNAGSGSRSLLLLLLRLRLWLRYYQRFCILRRHRGEGELLLLFCSVFGESVGTKKDSCFSCFVSRLIWTR